MVNDQEAQAASPAAATETVAAATDSTTSTEEKKVTKDDLIELIRAIKFSNPEASIRNVHTEIKTKMSLNESFEFLEHVKLNDVKKVWKKAITGGSNATTNNDSTSTNTNNANDNANANDNKDTFKSEITNKSKKDGILQFYTVGDGSVKTLAKNYTLQAAAQALALDDNNDIDNVNNQEDMKKYINCFLDVPADCSGGKPHQALINFNDKKPKKKNKKKKNQQSKKGTISSTTTATDGTTDGATDGATDTKEDGREIVKIQVAAEIPGMDNPNTPMLLYNLSRSARTFIHDDDSNTKNNDDNNDNSNDDDNNNGGYGKIKNMICTHGMNGALSGGGTKAYFYAHITRRGVGEQDIISIDASELAPAQKW